jgi:hypothetical protein
MLLQISDRMRQKNTLCRSCTISIRHNSCEMCGEQSGTGKTFRPSNSFSLSQYLSISPTDSSSPICCSNQKETDKNLKALKHSSILSELGNIGKKGTSIVSVRFYHEIKQAACRSRIKSLRKCDVCSTRQGEAQRRKYWRLLGSLNLASVKIMTVQMTKLSLIELQFSHLLHYM